MNAKNFQAGGVIELQGSKATPRAVHVFDDRSINAIKAAMAAKRPLLVRGEPGIGKSQLARAAAKALGRAYLPAVVDVRTESRDLLWHFDAVKRLADAQLSGALHDDLAAARDSLAVENYLHPRTLWWAFDWENAKTQAAEVACPQPPQADGGDPAKGCLVLIDEIDKGESDVPNGLLEALGAGSFTPEGRAKPVTAVGVAPLVVITTNEERALPDAFVRRCLVLHLTLPTDNNELIEGLKTRGRAHFEDADSSVLIRAAEILADDRRAALEASRTPLPGQAEYLDLVRAVLALKPGDPAAQEQALEEVARYAVKKHPESGG